MWDSSNIRRPCSWPFFLGFGVVGYAMAKISIPTGKHAMRSRSTCRLSWLTCEYRNRLTVYLCLQRRTLKSQQSHPMKIRQWLQQHKHTVVSTPKNTSISYTRFMVILYWTHCLVLLIARPACTQSACVFAFTLNTCNADNAASVVLSCWVCKHASCKCLLVLCITCPAVDMHKCMLSTLGQGQSGYNYRRWRSTACARMPMRTASPNRGILLHISQARSGRFGN